MELMARGRFFSGSLVSAAAVPTSSMPAKAKMAIWKPRTKPNMPCGNMPPSFHMLARLASAPFGDVKWVAIMTDAGDDQGHDGDHLDDGEPELRFTEGLHGGEVQEDQDHGREQRRDPQGRAGSELVHVAGNGDDVRHPGDHPEEPVGPAGEEAGPRAQEVAGEVAEGLVVQVGEQDLAHGPHHEEQHEADDHVDEDDGRAGERDGLAGAHEQAGADRAADGEQLDVAVAEGAGEVRLAVPGVTVGGGGSSSLGNVRFCSGRSGRGGAFRHEASSLSQAVAGGGSAVRAARIRQSVTEVTVLAGRSRLGPVFRGPCCRSGPRMWSGWSVGCRRAPGGTRLPEGAGRPGILRGLWGGCDVGTAARCGRWHRFSVDRPPAGRLDSCRPS